MIEMTEPEPDPSRTLSVALLECDHVNPDLRGIAGDYGEMFSELFGTHCPEVALDHIDVVGGAPLPELGVHDGIVISGSRQSVTDDLPWIHSLTQLVREAHLRTVPLVGICFGHQLIAHALGGRVERAAAGWGVGVHEAIVTQARGWMDPPIPGFRMLLSHQDQIAAIPPGATIIAASDHAPVAALEMGSLLGFQGHPEFVADYADALMAQRVERIGMEVIHRARATLGHPTDHGIVARWITRFLSEAHTRAG